MHKLDIEKLKVLPVQLIKVVGGVNSALHLVEDDEIVRLPVEMSVAEGFRHEMKASNFMHAIPCSMTVYDEHVISITHRVSFSECKDAVQQAKNRIINDTSHPWYFDGDSAYQISDNIEQVFANAEEADSDGAWHTVAVDVIDLSNLPAPAIKVKRECILYIASEGHYAISAPVWIAQPHIGDLDELNHVNLTFALSCANVLSKLYGDDIAEALNLPDLMTQLQTVNLPSLPKSVKSTVSCGLTVKQAFAWLMGFHVRATTLEEVITIRRQMKYLTGKGTFKKDLFDVSKVYKAGVDPTQSLLKPIEELRHEGNISLDD